MVEDAYKVAVLRRVVMEASPLASVGLEVPPGPQNELGQVCPNCGAMDCHPQVIGDVRVCKCLECQTEFPILQESRARKVVETVFEARRGLLRRRVRRSSDRDTALKQEVLRSLSR